MNLVSRKEGVLMARINLDEAIRLTVGATDACESVHDCATRAYCAGELTEAEMDGICDAADAEKMEAYRAAVKLAPADFLDALLTQQRRWQ